MLHFILFVLLTVLMGLLERIQLNSGHIIGFNDESNVQVFDPHVQVHVLLVILVLVLDVVLNQLQFGLWLVLLLGGLLLALLLRRVQ